MISEFLSRGTAVGANTEQTAQAQQQFLRMHLLPDTTAMLPVQQTTEVLTIPIAQVVPIPHMPAWVMGVYNWRGEILWMVDLGQLVGFGSLHQQATSRSNYTVVVIHNSGQVPGKQQDNQKTKKVLGLLVSRIEDIEWCNPDEIQSPPLSAITPELVPFLRGYWLKSNGEILVALDSNSIFAGMP
jgi:positive phototaxis protein PixI